MSYLKILCVCFSSCFLTLQPNVAIGYAAFCSRTIPGPPHVIFNISPQLVTRWSLEMGK